MQNKLMKNREVLSCLMMYFLGYIVIFGTVMSFLVSKIADVSILIAIQLFFEFIVMMVIIKNCKKLFIDVQYSVTAKIIMNIPIYHMCILFTNIITKIPVVLFFENSTSNNQQAVQGIFERNMLYAIFAVVIFAPIVEELVFRGVIYKKIRRKCNVLVSALISSSIFAIMHFIISITSGDMADLIFFPSYVAPSLILCLVYEKHNNIFAPILLHLTNNLIGMLPFILAIM